MGNTLNEDQVDDLLEYCGSSPRLWKQGETLVCCPVHGESNASMGINIEKQVCHCFSCGFAGGFASLLLHSRPDDFGYDPDDKRTFFKAYRKAEDLLASRYELEIKYVDQDSTNIKRYEDVRTSKKKVSTDIKELPMYKLAPFMSGKETYKYFFTRGFTKQNVKEYMIGRDLNSKTVTIPIFNADGKLVGIIGRYISKNRKHNERYKIYSFNRGSTLYPLDKVKAIDGTIILVEGNFDAIRMRNIGYFNTLAIMSDYLTKEQSKIISGLANKVIYVGDNDKMGLKAREKNIEMLRSVGVSVTRVEYPSYGKDVCDWSDKDIHKMIDNAKKGKTLKIKRM